MKTKITIAVMLIVAGALAYFTHLPGSYFNKKTGTLILWYKWKFKNYYLPVSVGKSLSNKIAGVDFQVDYTINGVVQFAITGNDKVIYDGRYTYPLIEKSNTLCGLAPVTATDQLNETPVRA